MKLDINEIHFVRTALNGCSIKVSDAKYVSDILVKFDKEFDRLQGIEEKKAG